MDRRVIIFSHVQSVEDSSAIVFGISNQSLSKTFKALSLNGFASANSLLRHEKFDFAAGDAGLKCALFEFILKNTVSQSSALPNSLVYEMGKQNVEWLNFPHAAQALLDGADKRYLQLGFNGLCLPINFEPRVI